MEQKGPRQYDGSNAQWILKQNVYDVLCKAQERLDNNVDGCILDIIFGTRAYSPNHECRHYETDGCKRCIEDFLYREHR